MHRILLSLLAAFLLLGPLPLPGAFAGDGTPQPETWHFRKGEAKRTVDVTDLPDVVREAVRMRMQADGFERVPAPRRGRDLEADARELVEHGGRFPARRSGGTREGTRGLLLGAPVRLESIGEAAWLRVLGAPEGSLARALGLVRGDRILTLDGQTPTSAALARVRAVELSPGQLALRLLRREGRTEDWTLTFSRGAPPAK